MQQYVRQALVAGNWKMHGDRAISDLLIRGVLAGVSAQGSAQTSAQTQGAARCAEVAMCPPFPYLSQARAILTGSPIRWGAQNCAEHDEGAFTGEVSASMLADLGCTYVLVGHSERRALYGETDEQVATKFAHVQAAGLQSILCVGETLAERGTGSTNAVVGRQLRAVLNRSGIGAFANAVIAYEPVWAIGTGQTASPVEAQAVHAFVRAELARADATVAARARILYGGSVKPANAAHLFAMPDIDGGLIGGASLVAADFLAIVLAATAAQAH